MAACNAVALRIGVSCKLTLHITPTAHALNYLCLIIFSRF
jgi:hypothetical protein